MCCRAPGPRIQTISTMSTTGSSSQRRWPGNKSKLQFFSFSFKGQSREKTRITELKQEGRVWLLLRSFRKNENYSSNRKTLLQVYVSLSAVVALVPHTVLLPTE